MKLKILNKKGKEEVLEVKFTSFWAIHLCCALATGGLLLGGSIIISILLGA